MPISVSDFSLVLSGGVSNDKPENSLGGFPSPTPAPNRLDNLFPSVKPAEATNGKTDYRCIYIFNDNLDNAMYRLSLRGQKLKTSDTVLQLGFIIRDEVQVITITPTDIGSAPPASGSFQLTVGSIVTNAIDFTSVPDDLATSIQSALRAVLDNGVDVAYLGLAGDDISTQFEVAFSGANGSKSLDLIGVQANTISPPQVFSFEKTVVGSPINTIASDIADSNAPPINVVFGSAMDTTQGVSLADLGSLRPSEGFPIWVQRIVPANSLAVEEEGFLLLCSAWSSP